MSEEFLTYMVITNTGVLEALGKPRPIFQMARYV